MLVFGSFGLEYQNNPLELWFGNHPVFKEGVKINASDTLWSEFQACIKLGIDPDVMFKKDKLSRMLIVGGSVADSAIEAMRSYDMAKEREQQSERNRKRK